VNEQIKQFASEAGFPEWSNHAIEFELEQFAELLIFECVKIAVFNGNHVTAVAIKEKFGVGK